MSKIQVAILGCDDGGCSKDGDGLAMGGIVEHVGGGPKEEFKLCISYKGQATLSRNQGDTQRRDPVVEPLKQIRFLQLLAHGQHPLGLLLDSLPMHPVRHFQRQISPSLQLRGQHPKLLA
jgi:hypothetical protein